MSANFFSKQMAFLSLLSLTLCGCINPPFNDFHESSSTIKDNMSAFGDAAKGATGVSSNPNTLVDELNKYDIQYVQHGQTMELIVPTDKYFEFNSPKLNDICYQGLNEIVKMVKLYPCSTIYVAAFTDNIGSYEHKKRLSQAQAETMLTFLWANGIKAEQLNAEGFGDQYSIGDNTLIHGSAYNRRIEIQWVNAPAIPQKMASLQGGMK